MAPRRSPPAPNRRFLAIALTLTLSIAGGAYALRHLFSLTPRTTTVVLRILPEGATVILDGQPHDRTSADLVPGSIHILSARARGHVPAELSFVAERGGRIDLLLPHVLWPIDERDPPPLVDELSAAATTPPPSWEELHRITTYLELHRECLAIGRRRECEDRVARARRLGPLPRIDNAAETYLRALVARSGVAGAETGFRAELLAERASVDANELARRPDAARRLLFLARTYIRGGADETRAEAVALVDQLQGDRDLREAASELGVALKRQRQRQAIFPFNRLLERYNQRVSKE